MPTPSDTFERWIAKRRPRWVRSATALLKDRDEAENIVQATLVAVWEAHRDGLAEDLDRYAARAVWLNALRFRARRRAYAPLEALDDHPDPNLAEPDRELASWELERAILGLPRDQQLALRLRFYGGLSFKEIGKALSISMNTAASRTRYALASLRKSFQPDTTPGDPS